MKILSTITSKESLSVKRYKDPLQCVKDNWVMNCKGSYENEDDNIQDLVTIGRKDINYRQTITLTKKDNSVKRLISLKVSVVLWTVIRKF
jgi:hypothetical protein